MGRARTPLSSHPAQARRLIIAEKQLQAKTIADALLDQFGRRTVHGGIVGRMFDGAEGCVAWASGHILEIGSPEKQNPAWREWRLEDLPLVPVGMKFRYYPLRPEILSCLGPLIREATEVVNACDAGREGEVIFAEIMSHFNLGHNLESMCELPVSRMWIKATTRDALLQAWLGREPAHSRRFISLREAGFTRAQADWIWGYSLSRLATLTLPKIEGRTSHSIGRVQTPLLHLIYARCKEIREFMPEPFWRLQSSFRGEGNVSFTAEVVAFKELRHGQTDTHFNSLGGVMDIKRAIAIDITQPWSVHDETKSTNQFAHPPFNLLELQRAAARIFRWSAAKTLELAQTLYEKDHAISYPRTESEAFPEDMKGEVLKVRENLWLKWALNEYPGLKKLPPIPAIPEDDHFDGKKVGDHYAIMPTGLIPAYEDPEQPGMLREEYQLWRLITTRFLLAWLPPAKITTARRIMLRPYSQDTLLRAVLECEPVEDAGWLRYEDKMMNASGIGLPLEERMAEKMFPPCPPEARAEFTKVIACHTSPPHYLNDDTLLGYMKKFGLGTAATRADAISKVLAAGYAYSSEGGTYRASMDGNQLMEMLKDAQGDDIFDEKQTEYWEVLLGRIEKHTPNRPTRQLFLENIAAKVGELGAKLRGMTFKEQAVFDPDTGAKIDEDEKNYHFPKGSRLFGVRCPKVFAQRPMSARDYCSILVGGKVGGGPFQFVSKRTGGAYTAFLVFKSKQKSFEFLFKSRGNQGAS